MMASVIKSRRAHEKHEIEDPLSQKAHDLQKAVHRLTRIEKGRVYSGDRTVLYEKIGLIEESDIDK
jgi:hypothetical protein